MHAHLSRSSSDVMDLPTFPRHVMLDCVADSAGPVEAYLASIQGMDSQHPKALP